MIREDCIIFILPEKSVEECYNKAFNEEPGKLQAIYNRFNVYR